MARRAIWLLCLCLPGCRATIPEEEHLAALRAERQRHEREVARLGQQRERSVEDAERLEQSQEDTREGLESRLQRLGDQLAEKQRIVDELSTKLLRGARDQEAAQLPTVALDQLRAAIAQQGPGEAELQVLRDGARVVISADLLFVRGSTVLREDGVPLIDALAPALARAPRHHLSVEAHTDDLSPDGSVLRDSWALSLAQAHAVGERLLAQGLDPSRLRLVGFGRFHPRVETQSEGGRSQNRRLELRFLRPSDLSVDPR